MQAITVQLTMSRNYDATLCRQYDLGFNNNGEELTISVVLTPSTCSGNAIVVRSGILIQLRDVLEQKDEQSVFPLCLPLKRLITGQMKGNYVTACHEISVRFQ